MALITWDDSYSVDIAEIDQQHHELMSMINELHDAMSQGKGRDVAGKIVNGLIDYTATHFETEEKYFDLFGYSEAENHKKEHAAFVQKVLEFRDGYEKGSLALTIEVMIFLKEWLQEHIKGSDRLYSQFFNEKGLK